MALFGRYCAVKGTGSILYSRSAETVSAGNIPGVPGCLFSPTVSAGILTGFSRTA